APVTLPGLGCPLRAFGRVVTRVCARISTSLAFGSVLAPRTGPRSSGHTAAAVVAVAAAGPALTLVACVSVRGVPDDAFNHPTSEQARETHEANRPAPDQNSCPTCNSTGPARARNTLASHRSRAPLRAHGSRPSGW